MPFVKVNIADTIEREKKKSPEFKKAWDENRKDCETGKQKKTDVISETGA